MKFYTCIECGKPGHIKCSKEKESLKIKVDAKVMNDLNEFILQKFREAEISESEENPEEKEEVDAFDYVHTKKKSKKRKKLTKT